MKFEDINWQTRQSMFGDDWWEGKVSINDTEYAMQISEQVMEDDYHYFDWSIETGDDSIEGEQVEEDDGGLDQAKADAWAKVKELAGI